MSAQSPSEGQPPPKNKGLTPVQIGACVGATFTCLCLYVVRDVSHRVAPQGGPGGEFLSPVVLGLLSAIGALAGMSIVALVSFVRRRKGKADIQDSQTADAGAQTGAPGHPAPAQETKAEGDGSPILRVAAGVLALLLAGIGAADSKTLGWLVFMEAFALMFGWYAVRGRKGLPRFLTKKTGG